MSELEGYLWVVLGVVAAVLIPVFKALLTKEFPPVAGKLIPPWITRYLVLLVFALLTAVVVLAVWRSQNPTVQLTWYTAVLLGFSSESVLEKFFGPKP